MSKALCLVVTKGIKKLAEEINEPIESTTGLISAWQAANNKDTDTYPTVGELRAFRIKERGGKIRNYTLDSSITDTYDVSKDAKISMARSFNASKLKLGIGTKVNGIDVSNMTIAEAFNKLTEKVDLNNISKNDLFEDYYMPLWRTWASTQRGNEALQSLEIRSEGKTFFTKNEDAQINTARALARLISEKSMKANNTPEIEQAPKDSITKAAVLANPRTLYIFTDNTDRTSGSEPIREDTAYTRKYGKNRVLFRPNATTAKIRGVAENVLPVTTMKYYRYSKENLPPAFQEGDDRYERNRFQNTEEDFALFKETVDAEFEDIQAAWNSGKYDKIVMPKLTNGSKSDIKQTGRRARYYAYLEQKLRDLTGKSAQFQSKVSYFQSISDTNLISSPEEFESMMSTMPYIKVRDRSSLISNLFSKEVDKLYNKALKELDEKIASTTDTDKISDYRKQKENLSRYDIIKRETPVEIFNRVRSIFTEFINLPLEGQMKMTITQNGIQKLMENKSNPQEVQKILGDITARAKYKAREYQLIAQNFTSLAELASLNLAMSEGIKVSNLNGDVTKIEDSNHDEDEANDGETQFEAKEDNSKDGWMLDVRQISSQESLSQNVRKMIREIGKEDKNGQIEKDDLGYVRYLDADYAHAVLIDKLRDMVNDSDVIPMLEALTIQKPWIKQIIKKIQSDDVLMSQFYQDMRKDFISYRKLKSKSMYDGNNKVESIILNKPEGIYYLLDEWRDNYESREILDNNSVYNEKGDINKDNAILGYTIMTTLQDKYNKLSAKEQAETLLNPQNTEDYKSLTKALAMLGIVIDPFNLQNALNRPALYGSTSNVMNILNSLTTIFKGIKNNELDKGAEVSEEGKVYYDMINVFGSAFNKIALAVATVTENAIESSVRENGKSYYSHTTPSYLLKVVKQLKNVANNDARFKEFIEREFGRFEWFRDSNGNWNNTWLEHLINSAEARSILDHHVLLNFDGKEYGDWDALDYTRVLMEEYLSEPEKNRAWYAVPVISDSPSAEFIRFTRFTSDSEGTYEDKIIQGMTKVVMQEYNRIQLVKQRALNRKNKLKGNEKILHYDTELDENGNIIKGKEGGAEFKFIPALNTYMIGNTSFLSLMEKYIKEDDTDLDKLIYDTLKDVISNEFEDTMKYWHEIGLFTQSDNNSDTYKYLKTKNTNKAKNKKLLQTLANIEDRVNMNNEDKIPAYLKKALNEGTYVNHKVLNKYLQNYTEAAKALEDPEIYIQAINKYSDSAREMLKEFFYNDYFAKSQIIQLTVTDLAFYANSENFTKRFKEIHAPSLRMNTQSKYGKQLPRNEFGQAIEKTIYLKDSVISSSVKELIKSVLDNNKSLNSIDRDYILSQYNRINVADAQAYRSLKSYRDIMDMSGQWTLEMETAYEHLESGNWNIADFNMLWQTKKPYVFTQTGVDDGNKGLIKMGIQHKNSEFLLLAASAMIGGNLFKSEKLRAINQFMLDKNIDVVQFESAVKVGLQGAIDLSQVDNYNDVYDTLAAVTEVNNDGSAYNKNVVHEIPYEDYGIQSPTPEHFIDTEQLFGTQIRKLIAADMEGDASGNVTINGKTMTRQDWWKHYNKLISENIFQSFAEVDDIFKDKKEVEKAIQIEANRNNKYNQDIKRACTLNADGEFELPLFDQVQSQMIQQLLNSIIKNRITKQKIKGGSLIQVSNYGLTDQLNIAFKDNTGKVFSYSDWKVQNKDKTHDDFTAYIKEALKNKEVSIAHFECYMPAYSKEFYEPLMDPVTKQLDVNKLPEKLRKAIGYRIPTEDKYSMVPLYIKGFLPQQNGSAVMLPAEITVISGSDFDVDKLYVMLHEFKSNYNISKAWNHFYHAKENADIIKEINEERLKSLEAMLQKSGNSLNDIEDWGKVWEAFNAQLKEQGIHNYDFSETAKQRFQTWFRANKYQFIDENKPFVNIEYNETKTEGENSRKARNNRIIDMMWDVLTSKDTSHKLLKPGGYVEHKRAARISGILETMSPEEIKKALNSKATNTQEVISELLKASPDILDFLWESYKPKIDMLSTRYQIMTHQGLMTGANLIGQYANHNANHAAMQWTHLEVKQGFQFTLNGKKYVKLNKIKANSELTGDDNTSYVSNNNAGYLAAAVDNAKDPILAFLNQNSFTSNITMLLSRLGHTPTTIGLFLNQPIIKEITKKYLVGKSQGISIDTIMDEAIASWSRQVPGNISNSKSYKDLDYKNEWLAANILNEKLRTKYDLISVPENLSYLRDLAQNQVAVGNLFRQIYREAEVLNQLVQITRSDTSGGAVGPTIGDTLVKINRIKDFLNSTPSPNFPFTGANIFNMELLKAYKGKDVDKEELMKAIAEVPIPMLQAFFTLGLEASTRFFSRYFPQFNDAFMEVVFGRKNEEDGQVSKMGLTQLSKYESLDVKTINSVFNEMFAYIMNKNNFFGESNIETGEGSKHIPAQIKRAAYINDFPATFRKMKDEIKELKNLEFLNRIIYIKAGKKNPVDILTFKNVGHLSKPLKDRYTNEWASMLVNPDPRIRTLATQLFLYSYFRNGFGFGPSTFIHLAPLSLRKAIPNYKEDLYKLLENNNTDDYSNFIEQYIYNHLDNYRLVANISNKIKSISCLEKNGEDIKDTIEVTGPTEGPKKEDKPFYKSAMFNYDSRQYDYLFYKYISFNNKGQHIYYKLVEDKGNYARYERITPLGWKNQFLEYEYGEEADNMISAIAQNSKYNTVIEDAKFNKMVEAVRANSNSEILGDFNDEEEDYKPSLTEEYYASLNINDRQQVILQDLNMGKAIPLNSLISSPSIEDLSNPVQDETGENICGII